MVSIIVPIYNNSEDEIKRCVGSLVTQTYQDIEVILVDDGSVEETVTVEQEVSELYPCVRIVAQKNSGVSQARNRGLDEASGEFVCFVDADDYVEPNMIEKMISYMEDGCLVSTNFVHNDSKQLVLSVERNFEQYEFNADFINAYLNGRLGKQITFSVCNKLFHLKVIRANKIYFPVGVVVGEDMIFVLKYLMQCNKIRIVDEGLYHYSIRESSVMNATKKDYLGFYCDTLKEMQQLCLGEEYISETVLGNWALEILTYTLNNGYVSGMTYKQFCQYYQRLVQSLVFAAAIQGKKTQNFKRKVLRFVLKIRSRCLLFLIIKANH